MVNNRFPCSRPFKALFSNDMILPFQTQKNGGAEAPLPETEKRRGRSSAAVMDRVVRRNQRSSWRTLWFDWLASASAATAIDWRGDPARRCGASSVQMAPGG